MNNPGGEPFELVEADILDLIGNAFSFPTLPNQFMGFSLPMVDWNIGVIEPFETDIETIVVVNENGIVPLDFDDETTVILENREEVEKDNLSFADENWDYDEFDEWDYEDFDY